jgi:hypothetical protein
MTYFNRSPIVRPQFWNATGKMTTGRLMSTINNPKTKQPTTKQSTAEQPVTKQPTNGYDVLESAIECSTVTFVAWMLFHH